MSEPASSLGGYALAKWLWPIAKVFGVPAAGLAGALIVAAFDPHEAEPDPLKRRKLLRVQYVTGLVVAFFFTPGTVAWLDHILPWVDLVTVEDWLQVALPVGFLYGALAIGFIGALVKLRQIIADRGANAIADRIGLGEDSGESK
jgi:hypothetical protein